MIQKVSDILKEVPKEGFAVKLIRRIEFEENYAEHLVNHIKNQKHKPIFQNNQLN